MSARKLVGGELKKWFTNVNSQTPHTQGDYCFLQVVKINLFDIAPCIRDVFLY
jgi:hypothetical protein